MALGIIANALGGKTELNPIYGTEYGAGAINEWIKRLSDFNATTRPAAIGKYAANLDAATGENQAVSKELSDWYRNTIAQAGSYNPFETSVRPAADYAFTKLNELSANIPSLTRRANNQNAINLGLAPGGRSSAVDRAQFSNMAQLQQNSLASLLPWISQSAQLDAGERNNQFLRSIGAIQGLAAEPDRLAARALLPMNVEAAGYQQDIPNLAALIQSANANIKGYQSEPNIWARLGTADQQLMDQIGQVAGIAGSVLGGATGLGSIGSLFGGGGSTGGKATPTGAAPAGTTIQWVNGYPQSVAPNPWAQPGSPYAGWGG